MIVNRISNLRSSDNNIVTGKTPYLQYMMIWEQSSRLCQSYNPQQEHQGKSQYMYSKWSMYLGDDRRLVDVFAVSPPVQTFLLLKLCDVDISARQETLVRQIPDHVQAVPAATAQLLMPIHHLLVTTSKMISLLFLQGA